LSISSRLQNKIRSGILSGFNINYKPKSITGLLVAGGMFFLWTGFVFGYSDLIPYGKFFLSLGLISWVDQIDKHNKKSVNKRIPVRRSRR
jgi:hypothetical protein